MTIQNLCNPIRASKVALIDYPLEPLTLSVQHQDAISQLTIDGYVIPFKLSYCSASKDDIKSLPKGHGERRRLGDWTARIFGCDSGLFHPGNSLSNSAWMSRSIKMRWLMSRFSQIIRSMALQSIDIRKLVGCLIDGIVVHYALHVKGYTGWT